MRKQEAQSRPQAHQAIPIAYPVLDEGAIDEPAGNIQLDPFAELPAELLAGAALDAPLDGFPLPASQPLQVTLPLRPTLKRVSRSSSRPSGRRLKSVAGPIWTMVLGFIGIPCLFVLVLIFGSVALSSYQIVNAVNNPAMNGVIGQGIVSSMPVLISSIIMCVLFTTLLFSMAASSIVAIVELSKNVDMAWVSRISAIIASIVLFGLFLMFVWRVIDLIGSIDTIEAAARERGLTFEKSLLGWTIARMFFAFVLCAIIPSAVAINGFARNRKR